MKAAAQPITPRGRLSALRKILEGGKASTQEELCEELSKIGFDVTQSTVSRSLRKVGAVKATDSSGRTVYQLPEESTLAPPVHASLNDLILDMTSNGSIIVIHTSAGSASLVARHLDHHKPGGILGTIAGDDTIFVAPASAGAIPKTLAAIRSGLIPRL